MNLFDDTFSDCRWYGDEPLPLQMTGYESRLRQLKKGCSEIERPVQLKPPRRPFLVNRPRRTNFPGRFSYG